MFPRSLLKWNLPPLLDRLKRFFTLLITRFIEDQGLANAASLTFATLLALVPLMTVSLAVFSAFPVSDRVAERVQDFVFANFIPASGEVLQQHLKQFSQKAMQLTGAGFAFLIAVALLLVANIDRALNMIWRVRNPRSLLSKFMVYWSVLTLSPLLIGVSMAVTSYLVSIPFLSDAAETLGTLERLLKLAPIMISALAFTLLYAVVPNRRIVISYALAGGVLAAVLFELAKHGFAVYITSFSTYEAIYGALAAVPVFLIWIYLSWMITLIGAEFACCLGLFQEKEAVSGPGQRNDLLVVFRLLEQLWKAQHEGDSLSERKLSARLGSYSEELLESLLMELHEARLVLRTEKGEWALARDLSEIRLLEVFQVRPFQLPERKWLKDSSSPSETRLGRVLDQVDSGIEEAMSMPLDEFFKTDSTELPQTA